MASLFRTRWLVPAASTLAVVGVVALADLVARPAHADGGGALSAFAGGLSRLLALPGLILVGATRARTGYHPDRATWLTMLVCLVPVYAIASVIVRWWWGRWRLRPAAVVNPDPPVPLTRPPDASAVAAGAPGPSRRQVLLTGRRLALAAAGGVGAYAFLPARLNFTVTRRSIAIADLPPSLDGFTVCQVSDVHHGPWTSLAWVRDVVRTANALRPDLIALTGDYVQQSGAYVEPVVAELAHLRARCGIVATLGNHDWWEDGPLTRRAFAAAGIPLIDNERYFVTPARALVRQRYASQGLCVAGIADLWEGGPDYAAALDGVPSSLPRIVLSHNPDVAEERRFLDGRFRVDLMLSGHTHGGQVRLPFRGTPVIPSRYGQKYASGLVQGPACRVFVSKGLGTTQVPLRLGVTPEIVLLTLRAKTASDGKVAAVT